MGILPFFFQISFLRGSSWCCSSSLSAIYFFGFLLPISLMLPKQPLSIFFYFNLFILLFYLFILDVFTNPADAANAASQPISFFSFSISIKLMLPMQPLSIFIYFYFQYLLGWCCPRSLSANLLLYSILIQLMLPMQPLSLFIYFYFYINAADAAHAASQLIYLFSSL